MSLENICNSDEMCSGSDLGSSLCFTAFGSEIFLLSSSFIPFFGVMVG